MAGTRNSDGRFVPGNSGGPGRPTRPKEVQYLQALTDRVTLADWGAIVTQAVMDAKMGDKFARDWLSKYLLPAATLEGDGVPYALVPILREKLGLAEP